MTALPRSTALLLITELLQTDRAGRPLYECYAHVDGRPITPIAVVPDWQAQALAWDLRIPEQPSRLRTDAWGRAVLEMPVGTAR